MHWKSPQFPVKKVHQAKSMQKVILILYFDMQRAVYQHIIRRHTTINTLYYYEVLRTLKRHMNNKRPDPKKIWLLHHNKTKPPTASIIRQFLGKGIIEVLTHPTSCSNLAPCEFWVFGALKWESHNTHFELYVELVTAINRFFQDFPPEAFHKTMMPHGRRECWLVCIADDLILWILTTMTKN